jgi:16S rRNA (cytosine1402-N4)-methyltransferase
MNYHNPVLLDRSVSEMVINPNGTYVDCTFGGGGHSKEILKKLSPKGRLIAFDQDQDAQANNIDDTRFELVKQNFRFLKNYLRILGIEKVDGILADLGVSSHQFDTPKRGFSTRFNDSLDMRMNQGAQLDAKEILNNYKENELADIFHNYGELRASKKIAQEIVIARKGESINTTDDLKKIFNYIPSHKQNKFLAQLFQALRIEVNEELEALKSLLEQSAEVLLTEGRLVVISYHSLEDRLVKRFMKTGLFEGEPEKDLYGNWEAPLKPLQSKVIIPLDSEIKINSRARSAKLRIAIKN